MAVPGYSLFELYQTAKNAKQIWNAFTDEFENAPARVRELVETCDYLSHACHIGKERVLSAGLSVQIQSDAFATERPLNKLIVQRGSR